MASRVNLLLVALCLRSEPIGAADEWPHFGPFVRLEHENPVLEPRRESTFFCPKQGRLIRWEEKDVFNPTAVVKDGHVHMIYRAEDTVVRAFLRAFPMYNQGSMPYPQPLTRLPTPPLTQLATRSPGESGGNEPPRAGDLGGWRGLRSAGGERTQYRGGRSSATEIT